MDLSRTCPWIPATRKLKISYVNTCNVTVAKEDKLRPGISDYAIDSS